MQPYLLIDRDGTLIEEPEDFQVDRLSKIKLLPQVIPVLLRLKNAGYRLLMVSNQDGLGTPSFPQQDFTQCQDFLLNLLASQGIIFERIFICPHFAAEQCTCRKPKTGLVDEYLQTNPMDSKLSWMIGDRQTDQQLAEALGINYLPLSPTSSWLDIEKVLLPMKRYAIQSRETRETSIQLELTLDCDQPSQINTPFPFFTHMLEQVAKHSGMHMKLQATGDIEVDEHHLIEDTAITLGLTLKEALGNKMGINRYGFTLPMDEALASIAIDLAGRSYCHFSAPFTRETVGGLATEMIPHFFRSLAFALEASIHLSVSGENHHHMIEACFKVLGRALKQATQTTGTQLPSTKGIL